MLQAVWKKWLMLIASPSNLKLVRIVHRIGKKMISATIQATIVTVILRCTVASRAMLFPSRVQVLADDADQEDRHDVGEEHCHHASRRRTTDVVVEERLHVDQERQVGRCITRPT